MQVPGDGEDWFFLITSMMMHWLRGCLLFFFWSRESFACMPRLHVLFRLSGRAPPEKLDGLRQAWLESCFALLLMLVLCLCVHVFGLV